MMKANRKILIGILVVVVVVVGIAYWQLIHCSNEFSTLANEELKNYKYCDSDSDCKPLKCGGCVNLDGASKYENLKSFCFWEPECNCAMSENCSCVNNTCVESF